MAGHRGRPWLQPAPPLARERQVQDGGKELAAANEELASARERAGRAEGESETLREQLKAERDERDRSVTQMREVEAARDAANTELAQWTAGGPLARALRALVYRRGRR